MRERPTPADPPELVPDIEIAAGSDAQRLALQQARVFRELAEWLTKNGAALPDRRAA